MVGKVFTGGMQCARNFYWPFQRSPILLSFEFLVWMKWHWFYYHFFVRRMTWPCFVLHATSWFAIRFWADESVFALLIHFSWVYFSTATFSSFGNLAQSRRRRWVDFPPLSFGINATNRNEKHDLKQLQQSRNGVPGDANIACIAVHNAKCSTKNIIQYFFSTR